MKKQGFSYLELIISMGLVVMVVFLTTPFLVHMSKATTAKFGEYRAYAKYDETKGDWVLYQNVRYGFKDYMKDDEPCPEGVIDEHHPDVRGQVCSFVLPNHVMSYKVHLYGGGGAGSRPYFDKDVSYEDYLVVTKGAGGEGGQFLSKQDNLSRAVHTDDNSTVQIYNCNDIFDSDEGIFPMDGFNGPVNCIGTGGASSVSNYNKNVQINLHKRFIRELFDRSSLSLSQYYFDPPLYKKLEEYVDAITTGNAEKEKKAKKILLGEDSEYPQFKKNWNNFFSGANLPYNVKTVGESGRDSYFQFDDTVIGQPAFAAGGKGGITFADNQKNHDMNNAKTITDDYTGDFYTDYKNYVAQGESGKNSNNSMGGAGGDCLLNQKIDTEYCSGSSPIVDTCSIDDKPASCSDGNSLKLYYFGAGGGGGAFIYNSENETSTEYEGGKGAGGAVVIEWN